MVHQQDISACYGSSRLIIMTSLIIFATPPHAITAVTLDKIPNHAIRFEIHIGLAAIPGIKGPTTDPVKLLMKFIGLNKSWSLNLGDTQSPKTDIISPSFNQDNLQWIRNDFLKRGNILQKELFLKADGMSGYHNRSSFFIQS